MTPTPLQCDGIIRRSRRLIDYTTKALVSLSRIGRDVGYARTEDGTPIACSRLRPAFREQQNGASPNFTNLSARRGIRHPALNVIQDSDGFLTWDLARSGAEVQSTVPQGDGLGYRVATDGVDRDIPKGRRASRRGRLARSPLSRLCFHAVVSRRRGPRRWA